MRKFLLIATLVPCLAQQASIGQSGVISGTVRGEDGSSVPGAYVSLHLSSMSKQSIRQPLRMHWGVSANQDGSFRFSGLRDGAYNLCVQAPATVWLNPCEWGLPIPSVALIATERSQTITISLRKGIEVPISIIDPAQHLLANEGRTVGAHLLVGVRTSANTFRPAIFTARDVTGRAVKVVIPFDKTVTLEIASSFFKLAVNDSVLSKPGTTVSLLVPAGEKPPTINVSVTGRN